MNIDLMKKLKVGDKIVKVREHYQNYDYTKVPCTPKIYTIKWQNGSEMAMEEDVGTPFYHSGTKTIYAGYASGWSNIQICNDFETYEDYIIGNYEQGIILDKQRHKSLEDFLEEKRVLDFKRAKEKSDKLYKELQEKYKGEINGRRI